MLLNFRRNLVNLSSHWRLFFNAVYNRAIQLQSFVYQKLNERGNVLKMATRV